MRRCLLALTLVATGAVPAMAAAPPLLLQRPAVSTKNVAFVHGGDLWVVDRAGGDARRLTAGVGLETHPIFSPDGQWIAFAGEYDGNLDVYVVATEGGTPRRLTYHPGPDLPVGWTPDGKAVLFRSTRDNHANGRYTRLFTVPLTGGPLPSPLPLPMAYEGSYSPDGKHLAYVPFANGRPFPGASIAWKRYRGGLASPVWIATLADSSIEKLPRVDSNDYNPMWIGERVFFLSDRDGPTTLYSYDPAAKKVDRVIDNRQGPDFKSAAACADAIVYDQLGKLFLYDLGSGKSQPLNVRLTGDLAAVRPRVEKVGKKILKGDISPTGARAVFEARGDILTVPADKGDPRNLTQTPGVAERDPAWSPDGKTIAYLSDESGEYELHLRPQNGIGDVKKFKLGEAPSFYYNPVWSPDGKHIAYTDKRLNYWYIDLDTGKSTKFDSGRATWGGVEPPVWSPDGRWLAYQRSGKNNFATVYLYSLESGKRSTLTDGTSDARDPVFDKNGKYLYFLASTDAGPALTGSMSAMNRPSTRSIYVAVLNKNDPSPFAPESDEEKEAAAKEEPKTPAAPAKDAKKELPKTQIDLVDLDQRILALPLPAKNYVGLAPAKSGSLIVLETSPVMGEGPPAFTVHRFDLDKRKTEKLAEGVANLAVAHDGTKMLYNQGEGWYIVSTSAPAKPGDGALKLDGLEVVVNPRAEWNQMFHEIWRLERDFLYDPHFHGLDIKAEEKRFAQYLPGLNSRHDFNYLAEEMLGELCLGHVYLAGGDVPKIDGPKVGLLGADFAIKDNHFQFAKVYRGENWNPKLAAPLTQPGAAVKEGEFLLAVNGRDLTDADNLYAAFEGTAGKQTVLKVGPTADGKNSRLVTVTPTATEQPLRHLAWVDDNRRKVDKMTNGKVAYVYMPNTSTEGWSRFNRYFFAQAGKDGLILDERFNGGGALADHVIDYLNQPLRNFISTREGEDQVFPAGAIFGPKVMLINEHAGSGGDYLPYTFRQAKLGPLVGKRTWGGLVGIGGYPTLLDGGTVTAPRAALWFPNGRWDVENRGVAPDVEVEFDPKLVQAGQDPQLEKAVAIVLEELKKNPPKKYVRPAYPDYYKGLAEPAEGK